MSIPAPFTRELTDPDCVTDDAAAALLADATWRRLIVLGDSVAAGVREPVDGYRDTAWADRVAHALRMAQPDLRYRNLGERDLLAAQVRERQLDPALAFNPDLAIVTCGGNDAFRRSFDPAAAMAGLAAIVAPLREHGTDVLIVGYFDISRAPFIPPPVRDGLHRRFGQLAAAMARVATEHDAHYCDQHGLPISADPGIYSSDRIHANARGHAIAATNVIAALARLSTATSATGTDQPATPGAPG